MLYKLVTFKGLFIIINFFRCTLVLVTCCYCVQLKKKSGTASKRRGFKGLGTRGSHTGGVNIASKRCGFKGLDCRGTRGSTVEKAGVASGGVVGHLCRKLITEEGRAKASGKGLCKLPPTPCSGFLFAGHRCAQMEGGVTN